VTELKKILSNILSKHPLALRDRATFGNMLNDLAPNHPQERNHLLHSYDEKVHLDLNTGDNITPYDRKRYADRLVNAYGLPDERAIDVVDAWVSCRDELRTALKLIHESAKRAIPIEDAPSPQTTSLRYRIPCGYGNRDFGFDVEGLKDPEQCLHPHGDLYAVVFSLFQSATNISAEQKPEAIRVFERTRRVEVNYAHVYRLQMVVLLLIKTNECESDVVDLYHEGNQLELDAAIAHINHVASLISRLAKREYRPLVLAKSTTRKWSITLNSKNAKKHTITVSDLQVSVVGDRVEWHGRNLVYELDEDNAKDLTALIKDVLGFKGFRPGQYEAIRRMLASNTHDLCIMPTGSGKSLIFYVLALLRSCPTFIICPTDILIQDQLRNLKDLRGFDNAVHLQCGHAYENFVPSNKLIYLTPQVFLDHRFIRRILCLNHNGLVGNVVLDEVHCISNWSHDFRPEYLMLSSNLREFVDKTGYKGFTATANYTVVSDIQAQLGIDSSQILVHGQAPIDAIDFKFERCKTYDELLLQAAGAITAFLTDSTRGMRRALVFTHGPHASNKLRDLLDDSVRDLVATYRHNDLSSYAHFVKGRYRVLIADSDMGIGINLPEISDTFHVGIPVSKSQYVQEIGRSTRSRAKSWSTIFYIGRESFRGETQLIMNRSTPIDRAVELLSHPHPEVAGLLNVLEGIPGREEYSQGAKEVYSRVSGLKDGDLVKFTLAKGPFLEQVRALMRYLFVLYRTGCIYAWYTSHLSEQHGSAEFYVDPRGLASSRRDLLGAKQWAISYLFSMGNYHRSVAKIESSSTFEGIIDSYLAWYYDHFLYHHREQYFDILDFIENQNSRPSSETMRKLTSYFSLSILDVRRDAGQIHRLNFSDVTTLLAEGVQYALVDNIRRSIENEYSLKLDYFIVGWELFETATLDVNRLQRVVKTASDEELSDILEQAPVLYHKCRPRDRLLFLNALCMRVPLDSLFKRLYLSTDKDIVYWGIVALYGNARMGHKCFA